MRQAAHTRNKSLVQQPTQGDPLSAQTPEQIRDQGGLRGDECLTLSRRQAAALLGLSPRSVDRLLDAGELRYIGSTKRISKAALLKFIHGGRAAA